MSQCGAGEETLDLGSQEPSSDPDSGNLPTRLNFSVSVSGVGAAFKVATEFRKGGVGISARHVTLTVFACWGLCDLIPSFSPVNRVLP